MSEKFEELARSLDRSALESVAAALLAELEGPFSRAGEGRGRGSFAAVYRRSGAELSADGFIRDSAPAEDGPFDLSRGRGVEGLSGGVLRRSAGGSADGYARGVAFPWEPAGARDSGAAFPADAQTAGVCSERDGAERLSARFERDGRRYDRGFEKY